MIAIMESNNTALDLQQFFPTDLQIQEMHKQGLGIAEIARRTGKDIGTVKKYREGEKANWIRSETL